MPVSEVGYCAMLLLLLSCMREREALLPPPLQPLGDVEAVTMETEMGQFSHIDSWRLHALNTQSLTAS